MGYVSKIKVGSATHPVASSLYGICTTAAGEEVKAVSCADFDQLIEGVTIHVKFLHTNSAANPKLNVNSLGVKSIYRYGASAPGVDTANSWQAGSVVAFTYDGEAWQMNGWLNDSVRYNSTAGWQSDIHFVPENGEIIVYTDKATYDNNGETITVPGIKIGDGIAYGIDLPFLGEIETNQILQRLNTHVNNTDIHITAAERVLWNNKLNCSLSGETLEFNRS